MASIFDGLAGALNGVFGAPVNFSPVIGTPRIVHSVFREDPITVTGADGGDVLIEAPTWRVPKSEMINARRKDTIEVADGRVFQILNQIGTGSPASDAFIVYELELLP